MRYGATDVPIIQLSLSSNSLTDTRLNDLGQNIIRPDLAVVHGASVPYPYGGKPRVIMVDLDQQALQSRGLSPADVSQALQRQNVILPSGDVKIGSKDYIAVDEQQPGCRSPPSTIFRSRRSTAGRSSCAMSRMCMTAIRCRPIRSRENGRPGALMMVRKTGGVSTLAVIDGVKEVLPDIDRLMPQGVTHQADFRSVDFRQGGAEQRRSWAA